MLIIFVFICMGWWVNKWFLFWPNEWMSDWANERMSERVIDILSEWMKGITAWL